MKIKLSVILGILVVVLGLTGVVMASQNNNHECEHNCHTPTPSPKVSPSPSVKPCGDEEGYFDWNSKIICPTPSPSVSPTPAATPQADTTDHNSPKTDNGTYSAPVCVGVYPDKPVITSVSRLNATEVKIGFTSNNVDKFDIIYGYVGGKMEFGAVDINGNAREFTIGQLKESSPINVQVIAWRGNCSLQSDVIDP